MRDRRSFNIKIQPVNGELSIFGHQHQLMCTQQQDQVMTALPLSKQKSSSTCGGDRTLRERRTPPPADYSVQQQQHTETTPCFKIPREEGFLPRSPERVIMTTVKKTAPIKRRHQQQPAIEQRVVQQQQCVWLPDRDFQSNFLFNGFSRKPPKTCKGKQRDFQAFSLRNATITNESQFSHQACQPINMSDFVVQPDSLKSPISQRNAHQFSSIQSRIINKRPRPTYTLQPRDVDTNLLLQAEQMKVEQASPRAHRCKRIVAATQLPKVQCGRTGKATLKLVDVDINNCGEPNVQTASEGDSVQSMVNMLVDLKPSNLNLDYAALDPTSPAASQVASPHEPPRPLVTRTIQMPSFVASHPRSCNNVRLKLKAKKLSKQMEPASTLTPDTEKEQKIADQLIYSLSRAPKAVIFAPEKNYKQITEAQRAEKQVCAISEQLSLLVAALPQFAQQQDQHAATIKQPQTSLIKAKDLMR